MLIAGLYLIAEVAFTKVVVPRVVPTVTKIMRSL